MCNLSQGIEEKGIAVGRAEGRAEGEAKIRKIILKLHKQGFTSEQIAEVTDKNIEEVEAVIAG